MPSDRSSSGLHALLQSVPLALGQLPEIYKARVNSALFTPYNMAFQRAVGFLDLSSTIRAILLHVWNELRCSDWVLRLLILGHLMIATVLLLDLSLYTVQRQKRPMANMPNILRSLMTLLNPSVGLRHLFGAWLMSSSPFGASFLQSHLWKNDDFVVVGLSFVDLFPGYVPEVSNGSLTALSILGISMLVCYAFLSKTRILVERTLNSVTLAVWLLSRSRLRMHKWTTMLSQIKSNYYADHQFGVALAIDIIQSIAVRVRSKISAFYATASLSTMSQLLEGYWAELSLLDDDLSFFGSDANQHEAEINSSLDVTFDGIPIMSMHVPTSPVDVQRDSHFEVDVAQEPAADEEEDVPVVQPTDALLPDRVVDDRRPNCEVEFATFTSAPNISNPSLDAQYTDDTVDINGSKCNLGDTALVADFDLLNELETFSAAKTALLEEDSDVVQVKVNKHTANIKYEMHYGDTTINKIAQGLDVITCDASGLFDDANTPVISLPRGDAGSREYHSSPECMPSTQVIQSEATWGGGFKSSYFPVPDVPFFAMANTNAKPNSNVLAAASLPDPTTAPKVKKRKQRAVGQEALKVTNEGFSATHAYGNRTRPNLDVGTFNSRNRPSPPAMSKPSRDSGPAKASGFKTSSSAGLRSGIRKQPRDSTKSGDRRAGRASLNLLSKRFESLRSTRHTPAARVSNAPHN